MTTIRTRTRLLALAAAAIASAVVTVAPTATAAAHAPDGAIGGPRDLTPETGELLHQARQATEQFRDVDAATAAGYERASDCEADLKYGAMGIHYANPELVADGMLDVEHPEILVYAPTGGGEGDGDGDLRLVAVEYFAVDGDQDLATDPDRPWMFDVPFDGPMLGHNPEMPIHYDLHVWLYRHNPAGLFAMWNPVVRCPEDAAA